MKARQDKIDTALRNATRLAIDGKTNGRILTGEAFDPTDLLVGAGFANIRYDVSSGDVMCDWDISNIGKGSEGRERTPTGIQKHLAHLSAQAEEYKLACIFVQIWPLLSGVYKYEEKQFLNGKGAITLKIDTHDKDWKDDEIRAVFTNIGYTINSITRDEGDYRDSGSGFGGYWDRIPLMTIIVQPNV